MRNTSPMPAIYSIGKYLPSVPMFKIPDAYDMVGFSLALQAPAP